MCVSSVVAYRTLPIPDFHLALTDPLTRIPPGVVDLKWLEGTWRGQIGGRDFEARYSGPDGGQILSASKYTEAGKAAGFEFERFEEQGDSVVLTPFPEGKSSVAFRLAELDGRAGARCSRTWRTISPPGSAISALLTTS